MSNKPLIGIIGAGRTGRILTERLKASWRLTVIDINPKKLKSIFIEKEHTDTVILIEGDASSYITLERASIGTAYQILITINDDETCEEIINILKKRFKLKNIFVRINNQKLAETIRQTGTFVVTPYETMANMILNQMNFGETVALNIGKGLGEIIQIELTSSSPLVGKPLKDLPPKQWIIGAIYRPKHKLGLSSALAYLRNFEVSKEDKFIIPNGNTVPKTGDKIILIGDPYLLRSTAQYLKAGASVFPQRHGDLVLVMSLDSKSALHLEEEFEWLLKNMEPTDVAFLTGTEELRESVQSVDYPDTWPEHMVKNIKYHTSSPFRLRAYLSSLFQANRFGLILYKEPNSYFHRVKHRWLFQKKLLNEARKNNSPVWFMKGDKESLTRITIYVSDIEGSLRAAELALDAAKKFELPVRAVLVNPPEEITSSEKLTALENALQSVQELAALYGLLIEEKIVTGNPVHETLKVVPTNELLVLSYPVEKKARFLNPPIPEKLLAKKFRGSILLLPV
ncbi:MAG: NAD-binding protein [Leptospirales bacterium]